MSESNSKDTPTFYAASVNPPRRAKRPRTSSVVEGDNPPSSAPQTTPAPSQRRAAAPRPPILPKQSTAQRDYTLPVSPDSESGSEEEDDYEPGHDAAAPAPKRRGRKPGTMSRSARESLRKLNHSRIEKARRTKINETLSTLSTLVGERGLVLPTDKMDVSSPVEEENPKKSKGKPEEKEFKLDVLVKTVEYMQDLVARVQALEAKLCTQCRVQDDVEPMSTSVPSSPKRRRPEGNIGAEEERAAQRVRQTREEEDFYVGDDEQGLGAAEDEQPSPMPFTTGVSRSTASPRLPPIASWLPHPYVDPSSLVPSASSAVVSRSPAHAASSRSPGNAQLPSPPSSGRFRPAITLANMPALTLPGPAHPLAAVALKKTPEQKMPPPPRQQRKSVSSSPTVSPTWTPEDESAASLLLQMSSKPRSSSISSSGSTPPAPRGLRPMASIEDIDVPMARASLEVVTPGSLLGMRD